MIRNELKEKLPDNWKEKFKHRDLWDPDGYGVASFDLGGEREKVLAINFKTEDIMDYFFDDKPDDEWISLDRAVKILSKKEATTYYKINKRYFVLGWEDRITDLHKFTEGLENGRNEYPRSPIAPTISSFTHKIIAVTFIPNPIPDKYSIANHIDKDKTNFSKENLEWCDAKWNSKKENKLQPETSTIYEREDGKRYTSNDLISEYSSIKSAHTASTGVLRSIRENKTYHGHVWKVINTLEEDYLSRHPLRDDWYQHPTMKNVRANGCGILEVDGKLRIGSKNSIGYYIISLGDIRKTAHRVLYECFSGSCVPEDKIIDHIIPVTKLDCNNSKENLRLCTTQKENMQNPSTRANLGNEVIIYDLFGNIIGRCNTREEAKAVTGSGSDEGSLVVGDKYIVEKASGETRRLKYIYYKFSSDGKLLQANKYLGKLSDDYTRDWHGLKILKKYLNTGVIAPDGYYYQQGDSQNMIYDPDNKGLIKKREEICWKDRNKNREDD